VKHIILVGWSSFDLSTTADFRYDRRGVPEIHWHQDAYLSDDKLSAGKEVRKTVQNQARIETTTALVHNRLTQDQGTGANESLHRAAKAAMRACGGTRNMQTLHCMFKSIIFKYNGALHHPVHGKTA
jgi:hypothetical protein